MSINEKIIKPKLGVLELARQLGNVSQACKKPGQLLSFQGAIRDRRRSSSTGYEP